MADHAVGKDVPDARQVVDVVSVSRGNRGESEAGRSEAMFGPDIPGLVVQ